MYANVTDAELASLQVSVEAMLADYMIDLERLVNIDCGSYSKAGVDEVGQWFADTLAEMGASIEVDAHAELGDTVVAALKGSGRTRALLVGHLDTVFDEGTAAARPFEVRDGRAYGPGVNDMKAGLLAGIYALRALSELVGELPFGRTTFIANPDEEIGSPSSTSVISHHAEEADVAFVLESARANGDIVSARKGIADYVLTLEGRAAHAGVEPEKGRSAVLEAAHKTLALTALNGRWPNVTVNVGVVHGGTRPNVVAERCVLEVDLRSPTAAAMEEARQAIQEIAAATTVPDVSCRAELRHHWPPMEKGLATAELAEAATGLASRLGFELHDAATGGASDANTTAGLGVPTLDGLGPIGGADHAPGEYTEIDSIVPRVTLLAALLLAAARSNHHADGES